MQVYLRLLSQSFAIRNHQTLPTALCPFSGLSCGILPDEHGKGDGMKRVIIIGSPGAGKSTFARKLRDRTGLPLFYLDLIWHLPDRRTIPREEFDARLHKIIETDEWIIDGNYGRTLEIRLKACDTVFLLDYPIDVCLDGAGRRVWQKREDLPWIEEKLEEDFRQQILDLVVSRVFRTFEESQIPHHNFRQP